MPTFLASQPAIAPGVTGSWQDVDISAYCPPGTTGVILRCFNNATSDYNLGYRKKGSSDDRHGDQNARCQCWVACGVDANRVLELYIEHAEVYICLVGYFGPEAVFFTNGIDKSVGTAGSWQDVDISADLIPGDSACLAFLEFVATASTFGVRKKGSDAEAYTSYDHRGGVAGLDANHRYENWINATSTDVYLLGYLKAGAVVPDATAIVTPGTTESFVDLTALPAGAIGGIYWLKGTVSYGAAVRANGASETTFPQLNRISYAMVGCDGSRLVEAKIASTTSNNVTLLGYFTDPTPTITTLTPDHAGIDDSVTIAGSQFGAAQGSGGVTVNGTAATIVSWADTEIVITVPSGATDGNVVVTTGGGLVSGGAAFVVEDPAPGGAIAPAPEVPRHQWTMSTNARLGNPPIS